MNLCLRRLLVLSFGSCVCNSALAVSGADVLYPNWGTLGSSRIVQPFDVVAGGADAAFDAVGLPDGSAVLVGQVAIGGGNYDFGILKLRPDGQADTAFGPNGNGRIVYNSVFADIARSVAIDTEGRLLVAGDRKDAQGNYDFLVCRFNAATGVAVPFTGGVTSCASVAFDLSGVNATHADRLNNMVLDANGKITLMGNVEGVPGDIYGAVARLLPSGALDATFGTGGRTYFRSPSYNRLYAMSGRYASNGKLVVTGNAYDVNNQQRAFVGRLTAQGQVDALGASQQFSFRVANQITQSYDLVLVDNPNSLDDDVVVVGRAFGINQAIIAKVRVDVLGLDGAFGPTAAGYTGTDFGGSSAYFQGIVSEPNGGFIAVGQACVSTCSFAVARYLADGMPDARFVTPGGENTLTFSFSPGTISTAFAAYFDHGGLVVAGSAVTGGMKTDPEFAAAKFRTDTLFQHGFD